jgi:aspartate aminotransferase
MTIAKKIEEAIIKSSWIRKMFEEGARLKAEHGVKNVFDFSLGNPNLEPPEQLKERIKEVANLPTAGLHAYMMNAGYPDIRKKMAAYISTEQEVSLTENELILTCGAAGALNIALKAILNPGEEVITPAPYFVEYNFYLENHGGVLKTVPTKADFTLNIEAISDAINENTRAVLINSPNNPTGQVYSEENLGELGQLLERKSSELNRTIYLISDEPYRKIVFDGVKVPSIFKAYKDSLVGTSYSKDLSIPGERIGYMAINPSATYKTELFGGMSLVNRTLGYINAPAFMQHVIGELQGVSVDISEYARKRELLCDGLAECGYEFIKPPGTFYLFPKSPVPDDVEFVKVLQEELILTVPGSGFGGPGFFRIAFCVADETITNAMPGFERAIKKVK